MLEGFRQSRTHRRLVVVGSANYASAFHATLREIADSDARIAMVGHVHDQAVLKELWCNSRAYLHGHSVGGTNPALLRAMGYGCCVLALDTVFNREVLGDTGRFFSDSASFTALVHEVDASTYETAALGERARARIVERYTWEKIADQYEELFERVTR